MHHITILGFLFFFFVFFCVCVLISYDLYMYRRCNLQIMGAASSRRNHGFLDNQSGKLLSLPTTRSVLIEETVSSGSLITEEQTLGYARWDAYKLATAVSLAFHVFITHHWTWSLSSLTGPGSSVGRMAAPGNGRSQVRSRAVTYQGHSVFSCQVFGAWFFSEAAL